VAVTSTPVSGRGAAVTELLATVDGGRHWTAQWRGPGTVGQLEAVDRAHAFLTVLTARAGEGCAPGQTGCVTSLMATADGGGSWARVWQMTGLITGIAFTGRGTGVAAVLTRSCPQPGGLPPVSCPGALLRTSDAGRHWSTAARTSEPLVAVTGAGERWWAVEDHLGIENRGAPGGRVPAIWLLSSTDDGRTWREARLARVTILGLNTRAALVTAGDGLLWLSLSNWDSCAMHGCATVGLWRSTDSGATWRQNTPLPKSHDVCALSGVVVALDPSGLVRSADGVNTAACPPPAATLREWHSAGWRPVHTWRAASVTAMSWPSSATGYAIVGDAVARSGDGGRTWARVWPKGVSRDRP
jgi:hypothetical protein